MSHPPGPETRAYYTSLETPQLLIFRAALEEDLRRAREVDDVNWIVGRLAMIEQILIERIPRRD
jgi:hypothetical protein